MKDQIKIAVAQMTSTENVNENLSTILNLINSTNENVEVYFFPENALFLKIDENTPTVSFNLKEAIFTELINICKLRKTQILLGSVANQRDRNNYNTTILINSDSALPVYDKMHLFDVDVKGEKPSRESDNYSPGLKPKLIKIADWSLGLTICYDLRFSNLFLNYALQEVDIISVPAAFLPTTGKAHWHALLRARAIESQCYVVASAQFGDHRSSTGKARKTYGHSLVVSPWGEVLLDLNEKAPTLEVFTLQKSLLNQVRNQIPMKNHRKTSLFNLLD